MDKYKARPRGPVMPEKPFKYSWKEAKTWARKQIRGGDIDLVTEWEDEDGMIHDDGDPYWPDVTIKDFQKFAEEHDVPIEDIKLVMHEGAFQYDRYFEVYKEPSEELLAEERKKFDARAKEYNYPEKLEKYNREMVGYNKKLEKYEKEMEEYRTWKRKREIKKTEEKLAKLKEILK